MGWSRDHSQKGSIPKTKSIRYDGKVWKGTWGGPFVKMGPQGKARKKKKTSVEGGEKKKKGEKGPSMRKTKGLGQQRKRWTQNKLLLVKDPAESARGGFFEPKLVNKKKDWG